MGGPPDAAIIDGGGLQQGVGLSFVSGTPLPATFEIGEGDKQATIVISSIWLRVSDLRIIGDSATGDTVSTRKDLVDLDWERLESLSVPFPDAPPGLYSRIRGTVLQIDIRGTVEFEVDGSLKTYELEIEEDNASTSFETEFSRRAEAGVALELALALDLEMLLADVPYTELSPEEGEIEVEGDAIESVLSALEHSFRIIQ